KEWVWKPEHPEIVAKYAPQGLTEGATPWNKIGPVFPHQVGKGFADKNLTLAVRETPASTGVALRVARAAVESMPLGEGEGADQRRLRMQAGGTLDVDELTARLNKALDDAAGARSDGWVLALDGNNLWLRKPYSTRAVQLAAEALRREPGVFAAVTRDELAGA